MNFRILSGMIDAFAKKEINVSMNDDSIVITIKGNWIHETEAVVDAARGIAKEIEETKARRTRKK